MYLQKLLEAYWHHWIDISGCLEEIAFEAIFLVDRSSPEFGKHSKFINGLESFQVQMKRHIAVEESSVRLKPICPFGCLAKTTANDGSYFEMGF